MEVLMPENKKFLIIQTAFIGDAILTLPMIQKLKELNPYSKIDVLAISNTAEVFQASPSVDEVIILDKRKEHKSLISMLRFSKFIRNRNYSAIYSPHRSFRTAFIVMQSGVKATYGFSSSSMLHVHRHIVEYVHTDHEVKRNLSLIGFNTEFDAWKILPEIRNDISNNEKVKSLLISNSLENGFIAIAPGSVWNTKRYPIENFKYIIRNLTDSGLRIVLIGGDNDRRLCNELLPDNNINVTSFAGVLSVTESIEVLRKSILLITNDSAPTHMGMAADIPVLTIYCSTIPEFGFYPYNNKSKYLSFDELSCKPCGIHGHDDCPLKHFDCANKLKPEIVIAAINELLTDKKMQL